MAALERVHHGRSGILVLHALEIGGEPHLRLLAKVAEPPGRGHLAVHPSRSPMADRAKRALDAANSRAHTFCCYLCLALLLSETRFFVPTGSLLTIELNR